MHVIFSDSSVFSAFNMIRALRRNEILAIQIDRGNGEPNSAVKHVEFFGAEASFQEGPFQLAGCPARPWCRWLRCAAGGATTRSCSASRAGSNATSQATPSGRSARRWQFFERTIREQPGAVVPVRAVLVAAR